MRLTKIHSFSGRASIIFIGSVVGQGIAFLLLPAIVFLYDAAVLGRVASTLAIMNISALVICLQYDQAVIVGSDHDLPHLMVLSSLSCATISIASGLVLLVVPLVFGMDGRGLLDSIGAVPLLPALMFAYGLLNLHWNYHLRKNSIVKIAVGRIAYYGGGALSQVAAGALFGATPSVFLISQIAVSLLVTMYLFPWRAAIAFVNGYAGLRPLTVRLIDIARSHANFPKFQMGAQSVIAFSIQMPVFALRLFFSDAWAGWYFMAMKFLQGPTTIASQAVGQLFYRDSAEKHRLNIEQGKTIELLVGTLFRVSLIPSVLICFALPPVVLFLFGEAWQPMALFILVSLPGTIANFVTSPVSSYLNVRGMQSTMLLACMVIMMMRLLGLLSGVVLSSAYVSIAGYSAGTFFGYFLLCRLIVQRAGGSFSSLLRHLLPHLMDVALILFVGGILFYEDMLYTPVGIVVLSAGIGLAAYREFVRGGFRRVIPLRQTSSPGE